MADAAKKPTLTPAQFVDNTRRFGSAGDVLLAKERQLYERLLSFAFSDELPPAVSLAAQKDALDRVKSLRAESDADDDARTVTPEEAAEAETIAARIAERAK